MHAYSLTAMLFVCFVNFVYHGRTFNTVELLKNEDSDNH